MIVFSDVEQYYSQVSVHGLVLIPQVNLDLLPENVEEGVFRR